MFILAAPILLFRFMGPVLDEVVDFLLRKRRTAQGRRTRTALQLAAASLNRHPRLRQYVNSRKSCRASPSRLGARTVPPPPPPSPLTPSWRMMPSRALETRTSDETAVGKMHRVYSNRDNLVMIGPSFRL